MDLCEFVALMLLSHVAIADRHQTSAIQRLQPFRRQILVCPRWNVASYGGGAEVLTDGW